MIRIVGRIKATASAECMFPEAALKLEKLFVHKLYR